MSFLKRKELLKFRDKNHPHHSLFLKKRKEHFKKNPNTNIKWGNFIADFTDEEISSLRITDGSDLFQRVEDYSKKMKKRK